MKMSSNSLLQKLYSGNNKLCYSFECLPVRQSNGNLLSLIASLTQVEPLFVSVPWHLEGQYDSSRLEPLVTAAMLQQHGLETLLHVAATGLSETNMLQVLKLAKEAGIRNIFALRGDRTDNSLSSDFPHASDLVRFIRRNFANQFTICVGGYPNGHPECNNYGTDLKFLKEKVDAGADMIITQIFFDAKDFIQFESDCRQIGIKVPIIPGIMPIQSTRTLDKITNLCQVKIPKEVLTEIALLENDKIVTEYGICKAVELVKEIMQSKASVKAVHFFTLNRLQMSYEVKKQIEQYCLKK